MNTMHFNHIFSISMTNISFIFCLSGYYNIANLLIASYYLIDCVWVIIDRSALCTTRLSTAVFHHLFMAGVFLYYWPMNWVLYAIFFFGAYNLDFRLIIHHFKKNNLKVPQILSVSESILWVVGRIIVAPFGGLYLVLTYHLSTIEIILTSIALIYLTYLQFWWTYLRYFKKKVR